MWLALTSRIKFFRGDKIRITLWGKFAYFLTEDVIGSQTVLIITSTMVQRFNGKCINLTCYSYHLQILTEWLNRFVPKVNECHKDIYIDLDIPETQELLDRYETPPIYIFSLIITKSGWLKVVYSYLLHTCAGTRQKKPYQKWLV